MLMLLSPLVAPFLLVVGWFAMLRWRGVPNWAFFGYGATLPVLCMVTGTVAGHAEDRAQSPECRDGIVVGLECGFGMGRGPWYLAAITGSATLALLAVVSVAVWQVRRYWYRGLPALTRDR